LGRLFNFLIAKTFFISGCLKSSSYISSDLLPRQFFRFYFRRQFINLRGKSSKWGLDKDAENREIGNWFPPISVGFSYG